MSSVALHLWRAISTAVATCSVGSLGLTLHLALVADHGWQLGEHGLWDKQVRPRCPLQSSPLPPTLQLVHLHPHPPQTEFELATRVPLIIKVPWKTASIGQRTSAFAELVDLHPTLAALAGLPFTLPTALPPAVAVRGTGADLSPLFDTPGAAVAKPGKNASFSQWPVCTRNASVMCMACTGRESSRVIIKAMGYSVRTDAFRYTVWLPLNTTLFVGDFTATPIAVELYDHRNSSLYDFDDDGECNNLAGEAEYSGVQAELHGLVERQYTWPTTWLAMSRQTMRNGQLNNDVQNGFYPYTGVLPVPP